jgi:hypothetical protein
VNKTVQREHKQSCREGIGLKGGHWASVLTGMERGLAHPAQVAEESFVDFASPMPCTGS